MWLHYNENKVLDYDVLMVIIMLFLYINFVHNLYA